MSGEEGFDRLRRRRPTRSGGSGSAGGVAGAGSVATAGGSVGVAGAVGSARSHEWAAADGLRDPQGRRTLFTVAEQPPCLGAVTLACSTCRVRSVLSPRQIVSLAIPSVHVPLVKRGFPSWMRCPACRRRTWVRLGIKL